MQRGNVCGSSDNVNSDVSSSEDEEDFANVSRTRRSLPHGTFAHALKSTRLQSNTVNSNNYWMSELEGNPKYGSLVMLYCRTGFHARVTPDGRVSGTEDETDPYAILEISSAGYPGHVYIRGKTSKLFIAMNKKGRLFGEIDNKNNQTVWLEELLGSYNTYMSRSYAHLGWYLAIKKSGKPKGGPKTGWGQKAIQFLPRRIQQ